MRATGPRGGATGAILSIETMRVHDAARRRHRGLAACGAGAAERAGAADGCTHGCGRERSRGSALDRGGPRGARETGVDGRSQSYDRLSLERGCKFVATSPIVAAATAMVL